MLNDTIKKLLICPSCGGNIIFTDTLICSKCNKKYPIIEEIPILIDERKSIFKIEDFVNKISTTVNLARNNRKIIRKTLSKLIPSITANLKAKENFRKLGNLLLEFNPKPTVLIIGGATLGVGIKGLVNNKNINFIEIDISFGPRTQIICDAHNLPFSIESIDGVIVQAVLEHVADPYACVEQIHRVLKSGGLVYSETPFIQQVHMGRYDFTRWTDLGHRRLFRKFEEIERGIVVGPASALAWSIQYFLMSFTNSRKFKKIIRIMSSFLLFWLKFFDYYLIHNISSYDAASGFYFTGKKTDKALSDRELTNLYRGI